MRHISIKFRAIVSRLLLWIVTGFVFTSVVSAQTDPLLSHYYEMPSFYNPGAIGQSDLLRIRGGARLQWLGIEHAPVSIVATGDMPVKLGKRRLAVGLALQQESLGLYRNFTLGAMVGYQMKLLGGILTPGLRIGLASESFKGSEVYIPDDDDYHQATDDAIPNTDVSGNAFDLGIGLSYRRDRFSTGLSLLHANSPTINLSSSTGGGAGVSTPSENGDVKNYQFSLKRTLYFTAAGNIPLSNTLFELMPSVIAVSDFDSFTGAATAMVRYNRFLSAGLGYRWDDAVALHLGVDIKNFYLGYSYEYPVSAISKVSSGSHEIIAGYSLKLDFSEKNKNKHKSIRIM